MAIIHNLINSLTLDSTAFDRNFKRSGQSMRSIAARLKKLAVRQQRELARDRK